MVDTEFRELVATRVQALNTLVSSARNITNADDYGDMLGALRLSEIAAQQARSAIIHEARAAGETWEDIAEALGCTTSRARSQFG